MLETLFLLTQLTRPDCPEPEVWLNRELPVQERGWATSSEKSQVRSRMAATWRAMGADADAVEVLLAVVARESFNGDPCAVHRLGKGEWGLGAGGLSVRWQLRRWDADAPSWVLFVPEVQAVVMLRLARSSLRFPDGETAKAGTWLRFQQIYAGRFWHSNERADARWCERLGKRGIECRDAIGDALGTKQGSGPLHAGPTEDQEAFVLALQSRFQTKRPPRSRETGAASGSDRS